jgi:hypothetical protein
MGRAELERLAAQQRAERAARERAEAEARQRENEDRDSFFGNIAKLEFGDAWDQSGGRAVSYLASESGLRTLAHTVVNMAVGSWSAYMGVALCAGFGVATAGMGLAVCGMAAGALFAASYGTVAHTGLALATGEEITGERVARWTVQSASGGITAGGVLGGTGNTLLGHSMQWVRAGTQRLTSIGRQMFGGH